MSTEVCKALSSAIRVRILGLLLQAGELCGCEVEATLDISQTRASRALSTLRRAGLVVDRRDGTWVHFSVPRRPTGLVAAILRGLRQELSSDPVARADLKNLQRRRCA